MIMAECPECGKFYTPKRSVQRYCSDQCKSAHSERNRQKNQSVWDRLFVAIDGEGIGDKYVLLASSLSKDSYIYNREGLSTKECLDFLLAIPQWTNRVWFFLSYDVNMILQDVPLLGPHHSLEELYLTGATFWQGYRIRYIPKKVFQVSKGKRSFLSYDVFGFFQRSFLKACEKWGVELDPIIEKGKQARGDFASWPDQDIITYNGAELQALQRLIFAYYQAHNKAGLPPLKRLDGSGASAAAWLESIRAKSFLPTDLPEEVEQAGRYAYFGGRIETSGWGEGDSLHHYDIRSAYPAAIMECPDLSKLSWKQKEWKGESFALVHVRWQVDFSSPWRWGPLPFREKGGTIIFPSFGEGTYWGCEVSSALERFPDSIEVLDSWIPEGDFVYPFRDIVIDMYQRRSEDDRMNLPIKLVLNSLYGKFAQRQVGEHLPPYQNYLWAGYITAFTRAKLNHAIHLANGQVYMTMTDGVYSAVPLDLPISSTIGEWEYDEEHTGIIVLGAGVYALKDKGGRLTEFKERGFGGQEIPFQEIMAEWQSGNFVEREVETTRFIGMGAALSVPKLRPFFRTFVTNKRSLKPVPTVGSTKRFPDLVYQHRIGNWHLQTPAEPNKNRGLGLHSVYPVSEPYHWQAVVFDEPEDREAEG